MSLRAGRRIAFAGSPDIEFRPAPTRSIAIWTYEVARRLVQDFDRDVLVYCSTGEGRDVETVAAGVHFRNIDVPSPPYLKPFSALDWASGHDPYHDFLFDQGPYYPRWALRIALAIRRHGCDLIHLHNYIQAVPLIRWFNPKVKIVLHMHCGWLNGMPFSHVRTCLNKVDRVLGCSDFVSAHIRARFPEFAHRVKTVPNGVDVDLFTPSEPMPNAGGTGRQNILFVGRISPEKGLHVLLDALEEVIETFPAVKLDIVGPSAGQTAKSLALLGEPLVDPYTSTLAAFFPGNYLVQLLERMPRQLLHAVAFNVHEVPQAGIVNYYRESDLLVNPSLSESFGMSLVEGMACGLPHVATRVGGMPEVVTDGETGLVVEPDDPHALAGAICCILGDRAKARAFGTAGRTRAREMFTWNLVAAQYARAIGEIDSRPKAVSLVVSE